LETRDDDDLRALIERGEPNDTLAQAELLQAVERGLFGTAATPTIVGRYRLVAMIGGGGQGSVYVAHDPDLDRHVAVKLVRSDRRKEPDARARLLREALALAQLAHPNVVAVNDVGECEAGVFVVTQLVGGVTLRRWLERERSWREIVATFVDAGQGLAAAHERGIVHRDFKPSNVLVGEDGGVRLLDFGLARVGAHEDASDQGWTPPGTSSSLTITASGNVLGTPVFMAPEQYVGGTATAAADQYAFCVALYQALWKRPPFFGETLHELAVAKQSKWPPLRLATPAVPAMLRRLIERGLKPDPEDRWPSMAIVVERLRAIAAPRSVGRIATATIGLVLVTGLGIAAFERDTSATCGDAAAWSSTWSAERRDALAAAFAATGQRDAATIAARVSERVDVYVGESLAERAAACETLPRESEGDRRIACVERRRVVLDETLRVLEEADAATVVQADGAIADLPAAARCQRASALADPEPAIADRVAGLRVDVEHARALARASRYADALAAIDATSSGANDLGYVPLVAEAALVRGVVLRANETMQDAAAELERAYLAAESVGHDEIAFLAAVELVDLESMRDGADAQATWARQAEAALARMGDERDPVLDSELAHALAGIAERSGDYATAVVHDRHMVERLETDLPASDPRVARAVRSLAFVLGRAGELDEAETTGRRAVALAEAALGPEHPETARAVRILGWVLRQRGEFDESLELARRAI
jgi:tetratricopeptide (TPR) repeat protein